jgi:hypothetical protein
MTVMTVISSVMPILHELLRGRSWDAVAELWDKLSKSGASGAFVAPAKTYRRRPGSILRLVGQAFCRNYSTASKQVKFMYDSTNRRPLLVFVGLSDSFEVKQRSRTSLLIGEDN